jgi:hypothetical protein
VVKFLGLHFEASRNWNRHLEYNKLKCIRPLAIINYLRSTWIGAETRVLIHLYMILVRSRIEYGAHLFTPLKGTQATSLEPIQCKATRLAMGYMKSTPTNIILAEAKIIPLEMRFNLLADNYMSRIYTLSNHPSLASIKDLANTRTNPTWIHSEQQLQL